MADSLDEAKAAFRAASERRIAARLLWASAALGARARGCGSIALLSDIPVTIAYVHYAHLRPGFRSKKCVDANVLLGLNIECIRRHGSMLPTYTQL